MKYLPAIALIILLGACNQQDKKNKGTPAPDTVNVNKLQPPSEIVSTEKDTAHSGVHDTLLMQLSGKILTALKAKDFFTLSSFINPKWGIRFSPYAYIDTASSQLLSPLQLVNFAKEKKVVIWGTYDGKEEDIKMNISDYFDRFVYDKDFQNAEKKSVNKFLGGGNSLNNLEEVYPKADFTEFYFSGFDPKYDGMDWRTLRLVFRAENNTPYLIAIVHDEWTI